MDFVYITGVGTSDKKLYIYHCPITEGNALEFSHISERLIEKMILYITHPSKGH